MRDVDGVRDLDGARDGDGVRDADVTIVIPTIGRPSLADLLASLTGFDGPIHIVDDRRVADAPLPLPLIRPAGLVVLRGPARGPAAARNVGWRFARTAWIAFLDDDVVTTDTWVRRLRTDIAAAVAGGAVATCGRVRVPRPVTAPTDGQRAVIGLETAAWITADMAVCRAALVSCGGFDERFRRAYREDADLALRLQRNGGCLVAGSRTVVHGLRPSRWWTSLAAQRGNADDMLMRRLHGRGWRSRAHAGRTRRGVHGLTTATAAAAAVLAAARRERAAAVALGAWAALTTSFALARIRPGPRTRAEVATMAVTSAAIPPLAVAWAVVGAVRHRGAEAWRGLPDLVLFDRDGTLVVDVPYNARPELVMPVDGAREALDRLRVLGVRVGLATNQSGVARGLISPDDLDDVHARVRELLGPFDVILACPHHEDDGCRCRKPRPGLVRDACDQLGVDPARCVMVGDTGSDVGAGMAAGARSILIPTAVTDPAEVACAPVVAASLREAVDRIVDGRW